MPDLPRYDRTREYRWNYEHVPAPVEIDVLAVPGEWSFLGFPVGSPLGVPAGPLLNGGWVRYYASLGFDVLTYKTVRSVARDCYPLPNLQPVETGPLTGGESRLPAVDGDRPSWAVAFGMPSSPPEVWRADVEATRAALPSGKVLVVSVVGTVREGWTLDDLAADYATCARWAIDAGADVVETNFSCPNVCTRDGQLYQQPQDAAVVAAAVRAAIGASPFVVKVGHVTEPNEADALLDGLVSHVDGLAMTNSVATTVVGTDGELLFDGQPRGICGDATREASVRQTRLFADRLTARRESLALIGVGGASTVEHVREYLDAGASAVHLATAAMLDPAIGLRIREDLGNGVRTGRGHRRR